MQCILEKNGSSDSGFLYGIKINLGIFQIPVRQPVNSERMEAVSERQRRWKWFFKPGKSLRIARLESRSVEKGVVGNKEIHIQTISCSLPHPVQHAELTQFKEMLCFSSSVCILIKSCFRNWKTFNIAWYTHSPETVGQFCPQVLANLRPCCK